MVQGRFAVGIHDLSLHQQQMVREALRSVTESPHFRKSKRYPALLEYVVSNTLDGNLEVLKERVIGGEVFGRPADYDTSIDPVVRMAAGEVRKRMALYFSEHPEAPVRIDLPVGSYIAEFHFPTPSLNGPRLETQPAPLIGTQEPVPYDAPPRPPASAGLGARMTRGVAHLATLLLLAAGGTAAWRYTRDQGKREFWGILLHNDVPALVVLGDGPYISLAANIAKDPDGRDAEQKLLSYARASARICNLFGEFRSDCRVLPSQSATLEDLRNKTVVLVGALDNAWTERLLAPYRYQFQFDGPASAPQPKPRMIVDRFHPESRTAWRVDFNSPPPESGNEYAILSRFRSEITDSPVVVIAGLSPSGTNGAADYICDSNAFQQIRALAPKDWKGFNFEAVLQIDVVQGNAGHVRVVATQFW